MKNNYKTEKHMYYVRVSIVRIYDLLL